MGAAGVSTDPWAVLGIASSATAEEIRAAWKSAALRTHPDKMLDDGTQFRAVQAAYETLRDASTWHSSHSGVVRQHPANISRAEQAKAAAEQKAARTRHFEEKFRRFLAEEEVKKQEYKKKVRQLPRYSPAAAVRARQEAERHQRRLQESREQAEAEKVQWHRDADLVITPAAAAADSGTRMAAGSRQQRDLQQQPLEVGIDSSDAKAVRRPVPNVGAAEGASDTHTCTAAGRALASGGTAAGDAGRCPADEADTCIIS